MNVIDRLDNRLKIKKKVTEFKKVKKVTSLIDKLDTRSKKKKKEPEFKRIKKAITLIDDLDNRIKSKKIESDIKKYTKPINDLKETKVAKIDLDSSDDNNSKSKSSSKDPRFNSVVVVSTNDGLGAGFYVSANLILTNYHIQPIFII